MPIHAKKEVPFEVDTKPHQMFWPEKKQTEPRKRFSNPDERCEECYYWRYIAESSPWKKCCHYILDEAKQRNRISETECGSFLDKTTRPARKGSFQEVPVSQWGCPEAIDWKSQR